MYFQIRILDINDCEEWHVSWILYYVLHYHVCILQSEGTKQKLDDIRKSLVSILNAQCTCDITTSHISQGEFSCRSDPTDSVVYRARISGTPTVSASDLAALIRNWVEGGSASVMVGSLRLHLDPNCDATLDNIHALDCNQNVVEVTDEEPTEDKTDSSKDGDETDSSKDGDETNSRDETDSSKDGDETDSSQDGDETDSRDETDSSKDGEDKNSKSDLRTDENNDSSTSSVEVVGIMLDGIIAGLLLALLIALIIIIIMWWKKLNSEL